MSTHTPTTHTDLAIDKQLEGLSISEGTPTTSRSNPHSSIQDALSYIDKVKRSFLNSPWIYDEFLGVMKDFQNERISVAEVTKRIVQLFEGHPDLIKSFEKFLPPGHSIAASQGKDAEGHNKSGGSTPESGTASPGSGPRSPGLEQSITYLQRVKRECDLETYQQLLDIIGPRHPDVPYPDEEKMMKDVADLLKQHPDLIAGFRSYISESRRNRDLQQAPSGAP